MRLRLLLLLLTATSAHAAWPPPQPASLVLTVRENAGIGRTDEIVRTGVPLPRGLNVTSIANLTVVDAFGSPVPAQFRVLARWNAGLSTTSAPIQWLMVIFSANVPANQSATYRLVFDGSAGANPAPQTPLTISQNGNQITVNTGAATFVVGGNSLFESASLSTGTRLVSGSALTGRANDTNFTHATTRRISIEHSGPLSAAVIIEGAYDFPATGSLTQGVLGTIRRYVFSAGSPVAIVRQSIAWEGTHCERGEIECNGAPNAVRVQQVRDALSLDLAYPVAATAVGAFNTTTIGTIAATQTAAVRQLLRNARLDAQSFTVSLPGVATVNGTHADGGMLAVSTNLGAVAVALQQMHRYEPQALRVLSDGRLAIDLADNTAWLGARQGLFATFAVGVLPSSPSRASLDRLLWAPLHRPLRAWPQPEWIASSDAVDEFPVGALANDFIGFDDKGTAIHATTIEELEARGLAGIMTFGLYPRNWANPLYSDEIDCGGNDITPAETWDEPYWCGTWTDYHNTVASIPAFVLRNGQTAWLDELAAPGALRSLHTQIFQCGPSDNFFYCAQAPAGYGGYRADFNSSHAYLENLMLHYWLTGDATIVDMLKRGATSMRNYYCDSRPASACAATDAPTDDYANVNGRVFVQWHWVFRFVGLASDDASFLDDYRANLGREYTHNYAEVVQNGIRYGFLVDGTEQQTITGPGTYSTDQLWMASLYDMNLLYRLQRDTNDAPIGSPSVTPSQVIAAWARTLNRFGSRVAGGGNGTAAGTWPNALFFTFTGNRIDGALTSVTPNQGGGDPNLYDTGKAALTATMTRAADATGDAELNALSLDLASYAWSAAEADPDVLGKSEGEFFSRLPSAIARISLSVNPPAPENLVATALTATSISITWSAVSGATSYRVFRRSTGGGFTQIATPTAAAHTDTVAASTAHLYFVRAVNATGVSGDSNIDLATTMLFTDPTIVPGTTRAKTVHLTELRTAVNAVRSLANLGAYSFTDAPPTRMRSIHITELRSALDQARAALALPALQYTEVSIGTRIRAVHLTELRNGVR